MVIRFMDNLLCGARRSRRIRVCMQSRVARSLRLFWRESEGWHRWQAARWVGFCGLGLGDAEAP